MAKSPDFDGQRFGRLTVVSRTSVRIAGKVMWDCLCECGAHALVNTGDLRRGKVVSCGCYKRDHPSRLTHGLSGNPLYDAWLSMHERCRNPRNSYWHCYGGRGIAVCERWASVAAFIEDMGDRPEGTSLDRIDNDGDYEPGNCRWATPAQQCANKRNIYYVELHGERMILSEAARRLNVNPGGLWARIRRGTQPEGLVKV